MGVLAGVVLTIPVFILILFLEVDLNFIFVSYVSPETFIAVFVLMLICYG